MQDAGCRMRDAGCRAWGMVLVVVVLLLAVGVARAQGGAVIRIRLEDAGGAPVAGVVVRFFYEAGGAAVGGCTTGEDGGCEIAVENPPAGLIRGYLEVAGAGRRSLIWPGGEVEVPLRLKPDGSLEIATETIGGEPTATASAGPAMPGQEPSPVSAPASPVPGAGPSGPGRTPSPVAGRAGAEAIQVPAPTAPRTPSGAEGPASGALRPPAPPWVPLTLTVLGVAFLIWGVWQWRRKSS